MITFLLQIFNRAEIHLLSPKNFTHAMLESASSTKDPANNYKMQFRNARKIIFS